MFYAIDEGGLRIPAERGVRAVCPLCREPVVAKCGSIKLWHWAHKARLDCDPWSEGESQWHRDWKLLSAEEFVEVPFGEHRADIVGCDDAVIELQNSGISRFDIIARERFYGKMCWVLNGAAFRGQFRVEADTDPPRFSWAHPRISFRAARSPLFVHGYELGRHVKAPEPRSGRLQLYWRPVVWREGLFQIRTVERRGFRGTGRMIDFEAFVERMIRR